MHTSASNLDGCARGDKLVERAKEFGHPALAITDHGSPAGLYDHYKFCKKAGIKPILGLEFYMTNDLTSRVVNKNRALDDRDYHQSIFIKNKDGYKNFNYLTYVSFTDGYYYKPRIDYDLLFSKKSGLMVTSSCLASKFNQLITAGRVKDAEDLFLQFKKHFGDDFYGEIQFNELTKDHPKFGEMMIDQRANNQVIIDLCHKYDVPIMIGGDVHYLDKGDAELQDAIINCKRQAKEGEEGFQIHARHLYYHDVDDYYELNKKFGYNYDTKFLEQCFENSIKFSDKVNFDFETGKNHVPRINTGGMSEREYLEKITWEGISNRIEKHREHGQGISDELIGAYEKQIPYELQVIDDLGLNGYLLVVQDIINWEKNNGIYVGPGRGSAAGSVVAYAIGITDLCPITHKLLFERFINPNRKVMADIDWDSDTTGRDRVVEYLIDTYGRDSVCNVATFGTYSPKSALKDMSRGLKKSPEMEAILNKKICKIPDIAEEGVNKWKPKTGELIAYFDDLEKTVTDPEIKEWIKENKDTVRFADKLQGQMKSIGTHAGGIVVTPEPIYNLIPVMKNDKKLVTAFREADGSSKDLGELGILKLDVLGLKTLDVFKDCVNAINKDKGIDLYEKINHLDLNDEKLIKAFASGNNYGIFQMDRSGMFVSKFRDDGGAVDSFEDIVAINAMNRPGPLETFLPKYGYWKAIDKGKIKLTAEELEKVDKERYPFEFMRKSLEPTYGALLYQEQFMQMVCDASDFNFGEADSFRRGIAWRKDHPKYKTVESYFDRLEKGMMEKGYTKEDVDKFVEYCRKFMGYSFNRSHSVVYSYISWQTLFFKVYYPAYFYAAMLNNEDKEEKIQEIIDDAKKNAIRILPLSVSRSEYYSKAEDDESVRLGYKLIRGMGEAVEDELKELEMHKCTTIDEILQKPFKKINKTALDNLVRLGCFDEFGVDREMIEKLKSLYKEPKIEKWFSRKRSPAEEKTMPECLSEAFETSIVMDIVQSIIGNDKPHTALVKSLTPYLRVDSKEDPDVKRIRIQKETIAAEMELLGFSISVDDSFNDFARAMRAGGFKAISDFDANDPKCYFKLTKITELKTKNGKTYWQYTLNDGRKEFKAKLWRENKKVKEGDCCVGVLEFSEDWGWTLVQVEFVKS